MLKLEWLFSKLRCGLMLAGFWVLLEMFAGIFTRGALGLEVAYADAYKDIYLTQNRICKACRWEAVDQQTLRLINRNGDRVTVSKSEVLGMDRHPVWRRLVFKSLHGVGLPGKVIVPGAFEDGWEFACKYCDPL